MASTRRVAALIVITVLSVGAATWATVRFLARAPGASAALVSGETKAAPGASRRIKATLFYVAADGLRLASAQRDVVFAEGTSEQAKRILEALLEPAPAGLASAIPPGTAIRGVYLAEGGAAYVDFSASLRTNHPGGSQTEILTVYAIVSSLTANLPAITSVQILIDGHEVDTLAGHVDLRRPLPRVAERTEKGPS